MSQQDLARLDVLAKKTHRTRSDLVRAVLARVHVVQPDLAVVQALPEADEAATPEVVR
ncbi:MAG: ribbon-helix-helix protein, CopG family [Candidatus Entotheonellia bacterium]